MCARPAPHGRTDLTGLPDKRSIGHAKLIALEVHRHGYRVWLIPMSSVP
ncbi:hypothetical protein CBM2637_A170306 [Cupriavidus taiwanensis]|nr:hypothetical protein CBM2637_A170306 [Cupriavidus taiwanensis]SPA50076.1 protein of unknown function [Cupriavidus taiwanensis]